jgi:hypothetical protein
MVVRCTAIAAVLAIVACNDKGSFSLTNRASEPIKQATVTICDQTIEIKDIKSGHSAPGWYDVGADDHFVIDIEFESGKRMKKADGYVTSGMDFEHEIAVSDTAVTLIMLNGQIRYSKKIDQPNGP